MFYQYHWQASWQVTLVHHERDCNYYATSYSTPTKLLWSTTYFGLGDGECTMAFESCSLSIGWPDLKWLEWASFEIGPVLPRFCMHLIEQRETKWPWNTSLFICGYKHLNFPLFIHFKRENIPIICFSFGLHSLFFSVYLFLNSHCGYVFFVMKKSVQSQVPANCTYAVQCCYINHDSSSTVPCRWNLIYTQ